MQLSIITVNKNNANGLQKTFESVIRQTFKDYEYIIIDGASTDGSVEKLDFASIIKNYNIHWLSESDNGPYYAMNKGFAQAAGDYCLFLNSGDTLADENVLEKLFSENLETDIVYGDTLIKKQNGKTELRKSKKDIGESISMFWHRGNLCHQSILTKRTLLAKLNGYRTNFSISADYDFYMKAIFKYGATYKYYPIAIAVYSVNGISSNPKNFEKKMQEKKQAIQDAFPYLYKDIQKLFLLEKVAKFPGMSFILYRIYPLYHKIRKKIDTFATKKKGGF